MSPCEKGDPAASRSYKNVAKTNDKAQHAIIVTNQLQERHFAFKCFP